MIDDHALAGLSFLRGAGKKATTHEAHHARSNTVSKINEDDGVVLISLDKM